MLYNKRTTKTKGTKTVRYKGKVYRPPSEAYSLIVQVTYGCSHNRCAFCDMYDDKHFAMRPMEEIREDFETARRLYRRVERVFLADGDALMRRTGDLVEILGLVYGLFPECERVTSYASPTSIQIKSEEELRLLREKGVAYENNPNLDIREYIHDMPDCLAAADLVIARAGAITLAELTAVGRASVLIPSPNVAENHQYHNAMVLANHKAAVVIEEKDLTGEKLVAAVKEMTADPEKLREIGLAAKALGVPNACSHITDELLDLYKTHRK